MVYILRVTKWYSLAVYSKYYKITKYFMFFIIDIQRKINFVFID